MKNEKEPSSFSIFITFVLLIVAIVGYALINKYVTATPNEKIQTIEEDANGEITNDDAKKIAKEKYYIAMSTLTNTKTDMDKLYNEIKTTSVVLTDKDLIDNLNSFNGKTFAENSAVSEVTNYDEAINDNFIDEFINNNVLAPNGFIGNIGNDYYIIKDKIDNYFFKEASFKVISKNDTEMSFEVINTNYDTSCVSEGQSVPNITCTDTKDSDKSEFKLVKDDGKWKVSEMVIKTN